MKQIIGLIGLIGLTSFCQESVELKVKFPPAETLKKQYFEMLNKERSSKKMIAYAGPLIDTAKTPLDVGLTEFGFHWLNKGFHWLNKIVKQLSF